MNLLYDISLGVFHFMIYLTSLFNPRSKKWVQGRRDNMTKLKSWRKVDKKPCIWFHCASLGEYEQGVMLAKRLRNLHPDYSFALSFFSPSGFDHAEDPSIWDKKFYLPLDKKSAMEKLIDIVNPEMVFIIKYEYWLNLFILSAAYQHHHFHLIPTIN